MIKNISKFTAILLPTLIITSPANSFNCDRASSQTNSVNNKPVNIPYDDEFKSFVPDSYACRKSCNGCSYEIKKFDSYYQILGKGCTLLGCPPSSHKREEKIIDYKLCSESWIFSDWLSYNDFSLSLERCINGYRNITDIKQQQTLGKNFSLEDIKTPEHTYISLSKGISLCKKLFNSLGQRRFNEQEISYFSMYLENRYFLNPFRDCYFSLGEEPQVFSQLCFGFFDKDKVKSQKKIFNYLNKNHYEKNEIITSEIIEQFGQDYQEYLTDKKANQRIKRSEFWKKLFNFIDF